MSEIPYAPPFTLYKTDHGVDGLDAKTWPVARFTKREKALGYLQSKGFTYQKPGGHFWHQDEKYRNTMGAISYELRETMPELPIDPDFTLIREASKP